MNNYTTSNNYKGPRLFGAPVGDFGIFQTALFIFASTLSAFFLATFVGITALLIYTSIGHRTADFSMAYMRVGLPVAIFMFLASTIYLGGIYIRRVTRR
jgi:hypothetical protein